MRAYVDVTGKNEDEAISKALSQLGMERDDVSVEILERAKSGFLGIGSCPAKVRVYYGEEEEPQPKPEPVQKPEPKPVQRPEPKPVQRPEEKTEKPIESERRPEKKQPRREPQPKPEEEVQKEPPAPVQVLGDEVDDEKAQAIKKFLSGLLEQMDSVAEVKVYLPEKGRYKVILEGQGLGALIGRRGETLDAIQQLTSYAVNRTGVRVRVQLDAENYRAKREQSLYHLAHKVAAKVVRYRRSFTLEPMNAYERHVIHTALQDFEGVVTHSTGVDPNRRVVVSLDREKK